MKKKFKKIYTEQLDESDCGIAALSMILKFYGTFYSFSKLRELAKTNQEGTTVLGLIKTAQKFQLRTQAIKSNSSLFSMKELPCPFIAHVVKEHNLNHYYVVFNFTETTVEIADPDPAVGIKVLSKKKFLTDWTGVTIFFEPSEKYQAIKEKKKTMASLITNILEQKSLVSGVVFSSAIVSTVGVVSAFFVQTLVDNFIPQKQLTGLSIVAVGLLFSYFIQAIFSFYKNFFLAILGQKLMIKIMLSFVKHVLYLPLEFFETRKTGEIVSRFSDASKIINALGSAVVSVFIDLSVVIIVSIVLAFENWCLFLITLLSLPLFAIVIVLFSKLFTDVNRKSMESNAKVSSSIIEGFRGIETVKSLSVEKNIYSRINRQFNNFLKSTLRFNKLQAIQGSIKSLIQFVFSLLVLWIGGIFVINSGLELGKLLTFNALLVYLTSSFQNIINLQAQWQSATVANNRLNEILEVTTEKDMISNQKEKFHFDQILVKNVSFSYGYGRSILQNLSLCIKAGEKVAIVGESGSGKSTLLKLLVNFYSVDDGSIEINSTPIESIAKTQLRRQIAYVPQTAQIFSGTIRENLLMGIESKNITDNEIWKACKIAEIKNDILKMPNNLNTVLDETGGMLSGGQRQRLTIARAMLSSAQVILFDESTSSLDSVTESKVLHNLQTLSNKTFVFVAHRLAITKMVDQIFVMDQGKLVESGSHKELIDKKGTYYQMEHL